MRRLIPFLLLLLAIPAHAQQTQTSVTGTIVDPNSVPYYPATVLACLVPATQNPTVAGAPISTNPGVPYCVGPAQTGITGTFQIPLYANSVIKCNNVTCSTQWQFTVTASGTAPPAGKGAQNFQVVAPITSLTTQDISGILTAAAPILLNSGGGGSSVGPGTPNFIGCFSVPTNLQNCTDAITDIAGLVTIPAQLSVGGGGGAASIAMPSGPTSGCQTPATGFNILCSDGTLNTFDVSLNGAAYTPIPTQSSISSGAIGQPAAYNSTSTIDNVPLYIVVDAVQGAGIGSAITAWVSGTTYPLCQLVTNSGNFMAVSTANGSTTPGTNKTIWYPILNATRPTQFDCAFYIAQSQVTSTQGVDLRLGIGTYASGIGMNWPSTNSGAGQPGVNIIGSGNNGVTTIKQMSTLLSGSGGDGLAMVNIPTTSTAFFLPRLVIRDVTFDANALAPSIMDMHSCQQCLVENIDFLNPAPGDEHAAEFGTTGGGSTGWVFELTARNLQTGYNPGVTGHPHGNNGATFSVSVSGGVPTITVVTGGSGYDAAQLTGNLIKVGAIAACSSPGALTFTVASAITAVTSTATGCAASGVFLQIYPQIQVAYGFKFANMSDSHDISDLICGGVGATACVFESNVNAMNKIRNVHPVNTFNGVIENGSDDLIEVQSDSVYNCGIQTGGAFNNINLYGSKFEWNGNNYTGSSDYCFSTTVNPPTSSPASINIYGDSCGNAPHQSGYAHLVNQVEGTSIDAGGTLPAQVNVYQTQYCSQFQTSTQPPVTNITRNVTLSNGRFDNFWKDALGTNNSVVRTWSNNLATTSNPAIISMTNMGVKPQTYTVATLPTASVPPAGSIFIVTDSNTTTPGACTGGGTNYMLAVTNGTSWTCH